MNQGRRLAARLVAVAALLAVTPLSAAARQRDILVFAAASLQDALNAAVAAYDGTVRVSYQSSSSLARQIANGAPADAFMSANPQWMDYLAERGLVDAATRRDLFGNSVVLIVPEDSAIRSVAIAPGFDLAGLLGGGLLAMGDPDHVPAGIYGRRALASLGVWPSVAAKVARAPNVRAALALVSRGETPLGIVYATDAAADDGVRVVGSFPPDSHQPVVYPAAVVASSRTPAAARRFLAFLRAPAASAIFERYGFYVLE